jgi:hypothetical protein
LSRQGARALPLPALHLHALHQVLSRVRAPAARSVGLRRAAIESPASLGK